MGNFFPQQGTSQFGNYPVYAYPLIPARLNAAQTAEILGFLEHDIPVLVSHKLLEPLGEPAANARKHFAKVQIMELAENRAWLTKATRVLYKHWQDKNASRSADEPTVETAIAA